MSLIKISNLTFGYEGSYSDVFKDVSFSIDTHWRLGLTGRNGRGKSTLLKILAGYLEYSGSVSHSSLFLLFPPRLPADNSLTVLQVAESVTQAQSWQIERELSLMGFDESFFARIFCTLSMGEQTRVLLAALFADDSGFLLIDEPTNHLDAAGRAALADYFRSKEGFILVSHDRTLLDSCIDHILAIERDGITVCAGNYSDWEREKNAEDMREIAENEKLIKDISRLSESSKQSSGWSEKTEKSKNIKNSGLRPDKGYIGHKAAKMMKSAKNLEKRQNELIEKKSSLLRNIEIDEMLKIHPVSFHSSLLVSAEELSVSYGENRIFTDLTFEVHRGDRVAFIGGNGAGKSSILNLAVGNDVPHDGVFRLASGLMISHVPQETSALTGHFADFAESNGIDDVLFRSVLRKLALDRDVFDRKVCELSEGQKKKLLIARSLCQKAHLYVWDEPLNYIDIISRGQIIDAVLEYKPTLMFVEHDTFFVNTVATKRVQL